MIRKTAVVGISLCAMASFAWGQETPPRTPTQPQGTVTEPAPGAPPVSAYPLELLGLLAPPAQRGPVTLTPSISISEEYNDNIFLDNRNRQWDLITSFSPALTLYVNRPKYQLNAGYSFSADIYARESQFNNAFNSHNFLASGAYRVAPDLTLTASDRFTFSRNTTLVASQGVSTGRQASWTNTFSPGMSWQVTPRDTVNLGLTHSVLRFDGSGVGVDSNTYGFQGDLTHAFTPRFSGILGYGFTYLEPKGQEDSRTHTPTVGFSYLLTPTLTATVVGGPAITEIGDETVVSPAGNASLVQTFSFGSASLQYARAVSTAGGFGGTTNSQTVSGFLSLSNLYRGLFIVFSPAYTVSESVGSSQTTQIDVETFSVGLAATYQIARYMNLFAGYTFVRQRTGGSTQQIDVDQNRVRVGVQFGYPFNFD